MYPPDPSSSFVPQLPPAVSFAGVPLYVTGDDNLLVTVKNAAAGVTVSVGFRTLAVGDVDASPGGQTIVPATDRSDSTVVVPLTAGWLVSVQAKVSGGTPLSGQTYVRISLIHGLVATAPELFTLCGGYVTAKKSISFPGTPLVDSLDGAGALRAIVGTTPGAGADVSETVPTGARWELIAFEADLTTAIAAANRLPTLTLDDGANIYYHSSTSGNETASQVWLNSWIQGLGFIFDGTRFLSQMPLPTNNRLAAGHRIRTVTFGIQGADQYASPKYLVREWIEGS